MASTPVWTRVDVLHPDPGFIEFLGAKLTSGALAIAPSDTVYGLLGLANHADVRARLNALKRRDGPYITLVGSLEQARKLSPQTQPALWERLERVWPGPVTVILPGPEPEGVSLRMPDLPFLRALLLRTGPLWSTSANPPGEPPPERAEAVADALVRVVDLCLDGGPAVSRSPSTLVSLLETPPRILRLGAGDVGPLLDPEDGQT